MSKNANQYHIIIQKKDKYDNKFYYADKEATLLACQLLNGAALKLYFYFLTNQNQYEFDLYREHAEKVLDIKKTSYHDGIAKLKELGYLVYAGRQGLNYIYYFHERPTYTGNPDSL